MIRRKEGFSGLSNTMLTKSQNISNLVPLPCRICAKTWAGSLSVNYTSLTGQQFTDQKI